jgi:hypothetical protein
MPHVAKEDLVPWRDREVCFLRLHVRAMNARSSRCTRISSIALVVGLGAWGVPSAARAAEDDAASPAGDPEEEAARDDNTPLPKHSLVLFEPAYTFLDGGGYTVEVKVRPTLRYKGFFVPGLNVPGFVSFARFQIYTRSIDDPQKDVHATGLTDTLALNGVGHTFARELAMAVGYATTIPMATSSALDHQQWQLGPGFFFTSEPLEQLQIALLVTDLWTITKQPGTSSYSYMTLQPQITWHFGGGAFIGTDATMTFDWTGNHRTDIPLDLGLGKAFGSSFVGTLQGWYTVAGANEGNLAVHVKMSFAL